MTNDYYDPDPVEVPSNTRALSPHVNNVSDAVEAAFDKLPTETELKRGTTRYVVDTGAANAYVVAMTYTPALTDGLEVTFRATNANTGASTINVNGLGAKAIVNADDTAMSSASILANSMITLRYSSVNDNFQMLSANASFVAASAASAAAAAASETAAGISETNAGASETAAETAETNAETAQTAAELAETNAQTAQTAAELAETNAETAQTAAELAETNAAASYDSFDDRYLGEKASDPTLDNDGGALLTGAMYWNNVSDEMKVYDGAAWNALNTLTTTGTWTPDFSPKASGASLTEQGEYIVIGGICFISLKIDISTLGTNPGGEDLSQTGRIYDLPFAAASGMPIAGFRTDWFSGGANGSKLIGIVTAGSDTLTLRTVTEGNSSTSSINGFGFPDGFVFHMSGFYRI